MPAVLAYIDSIGGPVVAALILLSVVALTVILSLVLRFMIQNSGSRLSADQLLNEAKAGRTDALWNITAAHRQPRLQSLRHARDYLAQAAVTDDRNTEVMRQVRNRVQELSAGLRPLEVIATVAPLLGLFGTVLGMIEAFRAMEAAGAQVDPAVLSGGIWQALLTTAVGLGVAIPVSLIHSFLERRHERLAVTLLSDAEQLLQISVPARPATSTRLKAVGA